MVEGSFATATNASPMPTARAPMPILRKLPPEGPTRWLPTPCASARPGATSKRTPSSASGTSPCRAPLEVIVDSEPDPQRLPVVGRVREHRVDVERRGLHVLPLPGLWRLAGRRVDALDDLPVEDVFAHQVEVQDFRSANLEFL